jgi:RNA polymerase-binding transcription factor DksA
MTAVSVHRTTTEVAKLTPDQLETLRLLLERGLVEQRELQAQHEALATSLSPAEDEFGRDRDLARVAANRAGEAAADLEHALGRIENGSYGTCETCGRVIPFERLEAVPEARRCVACPAPGGLRRDAPGA